MTGRRVASATILALAALTGLPALVQAQLFPNLPVYKRKREDCANESPYYSHVRRNYFGYFPPCWQRFPDGWGCPCHNPEAPNAAEAFRTKPLVKPEYDPLGIDGLGGDEGDGEMAPSDRLRRPGAEGATDTPTLPDRSPFRRDPDLPGGPPLRNPEPDLAPPGGRLLDPPALPRINRPATETPPAATTPSPFDIPKSEEKPRTSSRAPVRRERVEVGTLPVLALPEMNPSSTGPGDVNLASNDPLPPALPPGAYPPIPGGDARRIHENSPASILGEPGEPAKAPRRRGMLGGLFDGFNRLRR